jgi:hypothetical protein
MPDAGLKQFTNRKNAVAALTCSPVFRHSGIYYTTPEASWFSSSFVHSARSKSIGCLAEKKE